MKRNVILLAMLLCIANFLFANEKTKLILVHPTEYNLNLFVNLLDKNIVDVENFELIGIYHAKENYDYKESQEYINENNYNFISLVEISKDIEPTDLYQSNAFTSEFEKLFEENDAILFFGGPDLPPYIYGEKMLLTTRMTDPYRHYFEASFLFHLLGGSQNPEHTPLLDSNPNYPVYAICLGMQTMNIATGGTMIQDIPSEVYSQKFVEDVLSSDFNIQHRNYNNNNSNDETLFSGSFHEITIAKKDKLIGTKSKLANNTPLIYSNHHQAIEKLGQNLEVVATSVDGKIIEAISHTKYPNVLGIQFHPEGTYLHDPEIKYRNGTDDELKAGITILKETRSYQFHLDLWKEFSRKLKLK